MISNKYILYTGENIVIPESHQLWGGMTAVVKNKVYKLDFEWDGSSINGSWIFYIYDDLPVIVGSEFTKGSRGYEIEVHNVKPLREYNIDYLIDGINCTK